MAYLSKVGKSWSEPCLWHTVIYRAQNFYISEIPEELLFVDTPENQFSECGCQTTSVY